MSSNDAILDTKFHILCNISNFNPYKMTKCKWILNESDIVTDCLRPFLWNMCWNCILKLFVDNCYFVSLTLPQKQWVQHDSILWRLCKWFFRVCFSIFLFHYSSTWLYVAVQSCKHVVSFCIVILQIKYQLQSHLIDVI